jgi:hypothetical protein
VQQGRIESTALLHHGLLSAPSGRTIIGVARVAHGDVGQAAKALLERGEPVERVERGEPG